MKKMWECWVLAGALTVLGFGAMGLAMLFPDTETLLGFPPASVQGKNVVKIKPETVSEFEALWSKPDLWADQSHRLFIAPERIYDPQTGKVDEALGVNVGGIPLVWLLKHGVEVVEGVERMDSDGDGFSNILEFESQSDPKDNNSHPDYLALLRLQGIERRPFLLRFNGITDTSGLAYQIKVSQMSDPVLNRSYIISAAAIEGKPEATKEDLERYRILQERVGYRVVSYIAKSEKQVSQSTGMELTIDVSELLVENVRTGRRLPLVFQRDTQSPDANISFIMLMPGEADIITKVGADFTVGRVSGTTFRVVEADMKNAEWAVIRNLKDNKEIRVAVATSEDLRKAGRDSGSVSETPVN